MSPVDQPVESDLELVVSLSGEDVDAIDDALLAQLTESWLAARSVVMTSHNSLASTCLNVPWEFFSYRLRKLVAMGDVIADGNVSRELEYRVKAMPNPTFQRAPAAPLN